MVKLCFSRDHIYHVCYYMYVIVYSCFWMQARNLYFSWSCTAKLTLLRDLNKHSCCQINSLLLSDDLLVVCQPLEPLYDQLTIKVLASMYICKCFTQLTMPDVTIKSFIHIL